MDISINGAKITNNPGIKVNTDTRLKKIDLINTNDISRPIVNCINANAANPLIVVIEDEEISTIALLKASIAASLVGSFSLSSTNL